MPPKHYKTLTIRREVFKRLEEFAKSKGVSISDAIVLLLEYVDIYSKLEYLLQKEVCISKGSSPDKPQTEVHTSDESMIKTSVANIEPNGVQKNTIVKCIKRSKMRYPLESYISLFKHKGVLVDWWDDDQVCFELKSKDDQIEAL